ncbi:hypothetical protein [Halobacillus sp. Nhm2S1]|uniref:hypothetical protein n=1 Tax=Halobacillus sp. Nhm2S1 TaxID=2866716 RepID=UPI001C73D7B0|nr:hypothetical protein [Halobacillus sp. Nhm2S1]MBX0357567.1 hypothetical protein [Halobacillus sp. Nhm2S1]
MKEIMIIRPEKEIGMGCCGGICSDDDGFIDMKEEFKHHDQDREKLGEWYRDNQGEGIHVDYVDPRNLLAILVYFIKHVKAGHVSIWSALRSIFFRMRYNSLFINGKWIENKEGEAWKKSFR